MPHYKRTADHTAAADELPAEPLLHPHVGVPSHCGSRHNGHASAADLAPRQPRPGSETCQRLPSRVGDRLYWPGDRVTDLDHNKELP